MSSQEAQEWYEFNQQTIQALLDDGSDKTKAHTIEYHFAGDDFDALEKAAVDAFKAGFEVTDAEELLLDDGDCILCFDAIAERLLDLDKINQDTDQLLSIATKHQIHFDGWGTYFIE